MERHLHLTCVTVSFNQCNLLQPAIFFSSFLTFHFPSNPLLSPSTATSFHPSILHTAFICTSDLLCPPPPDVAVQLPDKKSIIMYVTSLFAVLPKDVSMEAIREVETLPRKYKVETEDAAAGFSAQVKYTKTACVSCNTTDQSPGTTLATF